MKTVYLDHNATTPLDSRVFDAMEPYFMEKFGNASSAHQYGRNARQALEKARETVAQSLAVKPEEIIFTSGGTEADNLALKGVAYLSGKGAGHIITSSVEHHAVLSTCNFLQREGFSVSILPVDDQGRVDPDEVRKTIRKDTVLISVMSSNNETGVVQPIAEVGKIAREYGIIFHSDAIQSLGKIALNVHEQYIDMLSLSAHKIYGPKGIGVLYVNEDIQLVPQNLGGHQEMNLRGGTENIPAIIGFAEAIKIAVNEIDIYTTNISTLQKKMETEILKRIDHIAIHGSKADRLPHTTNIGFDAVEAESVLLHLDLRGIAASSGSACTTGEPQPSHVLLAMGLSPRIAQQSIRISLGRENTEEDVNYAVDVLEETIRNLRNISLL